MDWTELENECGGCRKCRLWETRHNVVIGRGSRTAPVMFVGEGPGEQEDLTGQPFVGAAGQLLDKYLAASGISMDDVYIANIVKCRPPENRNPREDEEEACIDYLRAQVKLIRPKLIACLGKVAASKLMKPDYPIVREHGILIKKGAFSMIALFHPAAILRDPSKKEDMYYDMKKIREFLDDLKK
ncbi:MAG: uracil-DNA glycosylase [Clostridia bacterium]|nr:uracil-DNA glycosylase [Clostridia bacterium]